MRLMIGSFVRKDEEFDKEFWEIDIEEDGKDPDRIETDGKYLVVLNIDTSLARIFSRPMLTSQELLTEGKVFIFTTDNEPYEIGG